MADSLRAVTVRPVFLTFGPAARAILAHATKLAAGAGNRDTIFNP